MQGLGFQKPNPESRLLGALPDPNEKISLHSQMTIGLKTLYERIQGKETTEGKRSTLATLTVLYRTVVFSLPRKRHHRYWEIL